MNPAGQPPSKPPSPHRTWISPTAARRSVQLPTPSRPRPPVFGQPAFSRASTSQRNPSPPTPPRPPLRNTEGSSHPASYSPHPLPPRPQSSSSQRPPQQPPQPQRSDSNPAHRFQEFLTRHRNFTPEQARAAFSTPTRFDPAVLDKPATPAPLTAANLHRMQASTSDYSDFALVSSRVAVLTVEKLKNVLKHYQAKFAIYSKMSGRKAEFVERVRFLLSEARDQQLAANYRELVNAINNPEMCLSHSTSSYSPAQSTTLNQGASTSGTSLPQASTSHATHFSFSAGLPNTGIPAAYGAAAANSFPSTSASFGARGYSASTSTATAPRTLLVPPPVASPASSAASKTITWQPNLFYSVVRQLCDPIVCPKAGNTDRKSSVLSFVLTEQDRIRIAEGRAASSNPQYQVRLFSCDEAYYNPPSSSYPTWRAAVPNSQPKGPAFVEFPTQSEVRVNGQQLSVNIKGIKKKAGSTMPPDLSKPPGAAPTPALSLAAGYSNRAELIYTNSPDKRFYLTACLVLYVPPEKAVQNIQAKPMRSKEEAIKTIKESNDDPDIVAESFSLSLKCPLTFMRMQVPAKAASCSHIQCFDAGFFLSMVEQNPIFQCPVCSRDFDPNTLQVDGFTSDLLQAVPSTYDSVIVECDATWHTEDYKLGTSRKPENWQPPVEQVQEKRPAVQRGGSKAVEILDSDDDGYGATPPVRQSTVSTRNSVAPASRQPAAVIDLTLDSDDDLPAPAPAPASAAGSSNPNKRLAESQGFSAFMPPPAQRARYS